MAWRLFSSLNPDHRRRLRRGLAVLGWSLLAIAVIVVVALLLPAPRRLLLDQALVRANEVLPGELTVRDARWPRLGRLTFHDLTWTDGDTLLARVDTLEVEVGLAALLQRDVAVRHLLIAGVAADLPAVQARLAALGPASPAPAPAGEPAFPRSGALPPLPSLAVADLQVRRVAVTVAPGTSLRVDSALASLELRRDRRLKLALSLEAWPREDLGLAWRLAGEAGADSLAVGLSPLMLAGPSRLPPAAGLPLVGRLALPLTECRLLAAGQAGWPHARLDGLRVGGDLGDWTLDGLASGREPGRLSLAATWPALPRMLAEVLETQRPDMAAGWVDTLVGRWARGGPPSLAVTLDLIPPDAPGPPARSRARLRGTIKLPEPSALAPLLPPQLQVQDLGPILADLDATYAGADDPAQLRLRVDLGATEWLDAALIVLHGDTTAATLDTLDLRLPGLAVAARGHGDRQSVDLAAEVTLPDASLLSRWDDPSLASVDLSADLQLTAVGPLPRPRIDLSLGATAALPEVTIPRLDARASVTADSVIATLDFPRGLTLGAQPFSRLNADVAGAVPTSLDSVDVRLRLLADSPDLACELRGGLQARQLRTTPSGLLRLDALALRVAQEDLRSTAACSLSVDLGDSTATLSPLAMTGRFGRLDLAGTATPRALDASLSTDLSFDLDLLRPWLPASTTGSLPEQATVTLAGTATVDGTLTDPGGRGEFQVGLEDRAETPEFGLAADVRFDMASQRPWPRIDLEADLTARSPAFNLPGLTATATAGPDTVSVRLDLPRGMTIGQRELTSLNAAVDGLATADLQQARAAVSVRVESPEAGLDLTGHLQARGLSSKPAGVLRLDSLALRLADLKLQSTAPCTLVASAADSTVLLSPLSMAGSLGTFDVSAAASPDSVAADLAMNLKLVLEALRPLLPVPTQPYLPNTGTLTLVGHVGAGGDLATPHLTSALKMGFLDHPELVPVAVTADLDITRAARAQITLLSDGTALARLSARGPRPLPPAVPDTLDARLVADRVDLIRLGPLLPDGVSLSGHISADPRVVGMLDIADPTPDLAMSGGLSVDGVRVGLPDGSWAAMNGSVALSGSTREPVVRGGLRIEGGLLRIPEPPPSLLPTKGDAMLWKPGQGIDTVNGDGAAQPTRGSSPATGVLPDLEFALTAPGGLWLRGQGLDIELAGDLVLRLRDGAPALEGQLKALGGTMRQLGHVFRLERGLVTFYADEANLDPELDLVLSVKVAGNQIQILLGGTANKPELDLESDTGLSDGDIMALLLFGRTVDELDDGQSGLLTQRARQLAAAYGSQSVQQNVARQLGVDVLSIMPADTNEDASALTVGKYLSPKVLVRYEQLLSAQSAFFVHLDYSFWRDVKLHSQISQGDASGLELKWQIDW